MSIVSRTLTKVGDPPGAIKRWEIHGTDGKGRNYVNGPFWATQTEAETKRDTVQWDTAEADKLDALKWVQAGNLLTTFDLTGRDITLEEAEEYVFAWFAFMPGDAAISVVWWMEQFNTGEFNAIANRIGYSGVDRGEIALRVSFMFNTIGHWDNTKGVI